MNNSAHGLLLAAGAGRRFGGPKALVPGWLQHALNVLAEGGCPVTTVVLGAEAAQARILIPENVPVVIADDWDEGLGASLRTGLTALPATEAALVHLVDLPDVSSAVVARILAAAAGPAALARATYGGRLGHPVLIGRNHWDGLIAEIRGDRGAQHYLAAHGVLHVECRDLATGRDVDRPQDATPTTFTD